MRKVTQEDLDKLYNKARATVIRIRGSDDVPAFESCVNSEYESLKKEFSEYVAD